MKIIGRAISLIVLSSLVSIIGDAQGPNITGIYNASIVCAGGNITAYSHDKSRFFNTVIVVAPPASLVDTSFTCQHCLQKPDKNGKIFMPNGMNTPGSYIYNVIEQDGSKWIVVGVLNCTLQP